MLNPCAGSVVRSLDLSTATGKLHSHRDAGDGSAMRVWAGLDSMRTLGCATGLCGVA